MVNQETTLKKYSEFSVLFAKTLRFLHHYVKRWINIYCVKFLWIVLKSIGWLSYTFSLQRITLFCFIITFCYCCFCQLSKATGKNQAMSRKEPRQKPHDGRDLKCTHCLSATSCRRSLLHFKPQNMWDLCCVYKKQVRYCQKC